MIKKLLITSLLCLSQNAIANEISLSQVSQDVAFLADDNMSGRASFTPESDLAADYIANRFSQSGLKPLPGESSLKQKFPLYQLQTNSIVAKLNDSHVDSENIFALSAYENISWRNIRSIKTLTINASDDFSVKMQEFNQLSEDILIIAEQSHAEIFKRYQRHFSQPRNKLKINTGPTAVIILTTEKNVDKIEIDISAKISKQLLTNVVGVLPGNQKRDEMLLFSAHYDHVGKIDNLKTQQETKDNLDLIFNGADDDASGTSAVINLAEYFAKKNTNQRSLVFVAFAAEEIGGFGSKYFSENINAEKVSAMLNIEMIGKPSKFGAGQFWMTGFDRSNLASILNKNLALKNKKIHPDPYPEQQLFYRSDNATLARLGVAAHSFSSTQIDKDPHYHRVSDEFKTLDLQSMSMVIQSIAESVESLVDGSDTPTKIDTKQMIKVGNFY